MNPNSNDDGALTRNGVIEVGEMKIRGNTSVYRSTYPEDKTLGTCRLAFRQSGKLVAITQSGKCWWFGVGVSASGMYRLWKADEVYVVRAAAF